MSALALRTGAVNLGQGFPDTDGPSSVAQAAADAVLSGRGNQYPPGPGIPELRKAIGDHQLAEYGVHLDPDSEVLVTAGATEAIAAAMLALVDDGDEVIALEPFYDSYAATVTMARGTIVPVRLSAPDFGLDEALLRSAVTDRTRVILLNSPHNPTGAVLSASELALVASVASDHDLLVVADEVYEHLAFDRAHTPVAALPGMRERTITISSIGKSFSYTGWKIGWVTGPKSLVSAVRATKQYLTFVSGGPLQYGAAYALTHERRWVDQLRDDLARRRDLLCEGLTALGLAVHRPGGTYFVTTDVRSLGWADGMTFCRELPERAGVVAIPCSPFYADLDAEAAAMVRWTFCKRDAVLDEALMRLSGSDLSPRR
ncbi:MAG: pyridoxal phosphate-dependent aminotransferase [Actinomycetes bacterium]